MGPIELGAADVLSLQDLFKSVNEADPYGEYF
jgi:hypothetical protein